MNWHDFVPDRLSLLAAVAYLACAAIIIGLATCAHADGGPVPPAQPMRPWATANCRYTYPCVTYWNYWPAPQYPYQAPGFPPPPPPAVFYGPPPPLFWFGFGPFNFVVP